MREILFRGKRTNNGEWVEGAYMPHYYSTRYGKVAAIFTNDDVLCKTYRHPVDPATVGQYTGLTDKNGKKIFEGDILKFSDCGIYPVWWDADFFTFGSCWFSDFDPLYKYDRQKIEVIGNIHDNPELLENP